MLLCPEARAWPGGRLAAVERDQNSTPPAALDARVTADVAPALAGTDPTSARADVAETVAIAGRRPECQDRVGRAPSWPGSSGRLVVRASRGRPVRSFFTAVIPVPSGQLWPTDDWSDARLGQLVYRQGVRRD